MEKMSLAEYYAYCESQEIVNAIATIERVLQAKKQEDEAEQDDESE